MFFRQICSRCIKRSYTTAVSSTESAPPPNPLAVGAANLTSRRLIALHGQDAPKYLQGVITNNVRPGQTHGFYSAFLNAQGRVLHDVFIYPSSHSPGYRSHLPASLPDADPAYLIECDAASAPSLLSHIKRYKLRSKFTATLLNPEEWTTWSVWNDDQKWTPWHLDGSEDGASSKAIGCVDTRAPRMGRRIVLAPGERLEEHMEDVAPETTLSAYQIHRILHGVAEGSTEIPLGTALPQESNIDYMGGIDFRKGCYVGQELTIRTHHTGVVRKRILPVQLYEAGSPIPEQLQYDPETGVDIPPGQSNITRVVRKGRSAGKWLSGIGNVGLALCRLETMTGTVLTGEGGSWSPEDEFKVEWSGEEGDSQNKEVRIKAFVPRWHQNAPTVGKHVPSS